VLDAPISKSIGSIVQGDVDWDRRFDHMQQHTGQHLLSALLADRLRAPTASVHFGAVYSTVDVSVADPLSDTALADIEAEANALIAGNRSVTISFEESSSATGLRKPSDRAGIIRIVTIDGIDRSACGGTHVAQLGEIGMMLLRRVERMKGQQRIEFLCGQRAAKAARTDYLTLQLMSRALSAAPAELPALVENHVTHIKELEREQRRLQEELAQFRASAVWTSHPISPDGLRRIHLVVSSGQAREQQQLATAIVRLGSSIVAVTGASTNSLLLATSEDSAVDAGATMKQLMTQFSGRGGGSPRLAQGSLSSPESLGAIVESLSCTPPQ
jgi:alanyl-tRNA synthetase